MKPTWLSGVLLLILIIIMATGCAVEEKRAQPETWGTMYKVKAEDIESISITSISLNHSVQISKPETIAQLVKGFSSGIPRSGKLDIRPPDYSLAVQLNSGEIREVALWIASDASSLFTDNSYNSGYFELTATGKQTITAALEEIGPPA